MKPVEIMSDTYTAIVVDDEPLARCKVIDSLKQFPEIQVTKECTNGMDAVESILEHQPDLVFLDIQMPEMDGFDVIKTIGVDSMPYVIFITAYDQYAIEAFEKHAFDFLLKPYTQKRFNDAVSHVLQFVSKQNSNNAPEKLIQILQDLKSHKQYLNRIVIRTSARFFLLPVKNIDWIEASGNYVDIHVGKETHLLRETMNHLEKQLNPEHFMRIHRSTIVNIDRIQEFQPDGNDFLVLLKNGKILKMSRRYKDNLSNLQK